MKIKCPKCVSARNITGGDPLINTYTCTKCQITFTEDEAFM